jgi:hypothetical protein
MRVDFLEGYRFGNVNWAPEDAVNKDSQPPYPSGGEYK